MLEGHIEVLKTEAAKLEAERDRGVLSVSWAGLVEAAKSVGEFAAPVLATASGIAKLMGIGG